MKKKNGHSTFVRVVAIFMCALMVLGVFAGVVSVLF